MITFVRSVGERTEALCASKFSNVEIIRGISPFTSMLRVCFEKAIKYGEDYAICVDADVIPDDTAEEYLLENIKKKKDSYSFPCKTMDKLFNRERLVGTRIYNVRYFPQALTWVDKAVGKVRPESFIRKSLGYSYPNSALVETHGRHGYEQYYQDIYRTVRMWACKHKKEEQRLLTYWKSMERKDFDFVVATQAWYAGIRHASAVIEKSAAIDDECHNVLTSFGVKEKEPLHESVLC